MAFRTLGAISAVLTVIALCFLGEGLILRVGTLGTPVERGVHLAVVFTIAIGVITYAARVRGTFQDRLKETLVATAVMFGAYALVTLFGRFFISRLLLGIVIPTTLLTSIVVIWLRSRGEGVRAAVVTPLVRAIPSSLSKLDTLADPAADFRPYDLLLVDLHAPVSAAWASALSRAMLSGCRIRHIEDHLEELSGAVSISHFELEHLPSTDHASYIHVKRLMDILATVLLAPLITPIVLAAATGIVLTSGWPAFFIQKRVGLGGIHFHMWKLRTMRPARSDQAEHAAVPGDTRVTAIGRLLRRTRIDELPQFWNVLKGDMSLIGPRPETVAFHNTYIADQPKFAYRCLVRPGITGWAQVNAPPSANTDEALYKARYDLYYIKRQSILLDCQIAIRAFWTIIHGGGAR